MNTLQKFLPLIAILFLSYWAIAPFFSPGFFPMHDDTQVARVFEMHRALTDGMFPVRWSPDLGYGYGYPIFNFYAPLAYYIGAVIQLIGFDALTATKIMMAGGFVLAAITMYYFAKEFWGKLGGIVSALLYLYAPYHSVNMYVRGAVAELWAYAFVPAAFFGLYKVFLITKEKRTVRTRKLLWIWIAISAISYAAIILSHNLTALMVTPFLFAFVLFFLFLQKRKQLFPLLISLFLGIVLSAFYWLPTLFEMQYTNVLSQVGGTAQYSDHFICWPQLWESFWGYGGSIPGCVDGLSFMIGKAHILLFGLSALLLIYFWKKETKQLPLMLFFFCSGLCAVFLTLGESQFIWDKIRPMAFIQYPWRLLLMTSFFVSVLGGAIVFVVGKMIKVVPFASFIVFCLLIGGTIYATADIFIPQTMLDKKSSDYTDPSALTWTASALTDEYLPQGFAKPKKFNDVPRNKLVYNPDIKVISLQEKTQKIEISLDAKKQTTLAINHAYFPAWHVLIDNKETEFKTTKKGITISIPKGKHIVVLRFEQTLIENIGNSISLTGVIALVLGIIYSRRSAYEQKKNNG